MIAQGCNAVVCAARWARDRTVDVVDGFEKISAPEELAVKIMFNYDAESNATTIIDAMKK